MVVPIDSAGVGTGAFYVTFDVPPGKTEELAAYNIEVSMDPVSSGLSFIGAAKAPNAVFPDGEPTTYKTGDQLRAADDLPGVGTGNPILNDARLLKVEFEMVVDPVVEKIFTVHFVKVILTRPDGTEIPVCTEDGQIRAVPDPPPTVEAVRLGATTWASAFPHHDGYAVPVGSPAQLEPLPWVGLNQVTIVFSEDVVVSPGDLTLAGMNVPEYTFGDFAYDPETLTAVWTLSDPIGSDRLRIALSDTVKDLHSNALDGDWVNGVSTFPSGDGEPGGEFRFAFNVLPGDVTADESVYGDDVIHVRNRQFQHPGDPDYEATYDINGSGSIFGDDVILTRNRQFTSLPGLEGGEGERLLVFAAGGAMAKPDTLTVFAPEVTVYSNDTGSVTDTFDILFAVPSGLEQGLAAYNAVLEVNPADSGVTLVKAEEADNAVFPGQDPKVYGSGDELLVAGDLPDPGQSSTVENGAGLFRTVVKVETGVEGDFTLSLPTLLLFDADAVQVAADAIPGVLHVRVDGDGDGVADVVEDNAPNNGDGNGDETPDSQQTEVASFPSSTDGKYVTVAGPSGTTLSDVDATDNPSPDDTPLGISFPVGFFDYTINGLDVGGCVVVTVYLESSQAVNTYYRHGPTPDYPTPHWYPFTYDGRTGAKIYADRVELYFVDGLRGDDDLAANGAIVDPGAPAAVDHPWQNPMLRQNVNNDSGVSPLDVLLLINEINKNGSRELPSTPIGNEVLPPFWDVNGDDSITPLDVLEVIRHINSQVPGSAEGESVVRLPSPRLANRFPAAISSGIASSRSASVHSPSRQPEGTISPQPDFEAVDADPVCRHMAVRRATERPVRMRHEAACCGWAQELPVEFDAAAAQLDAVLPDIVGDVAGQWHRAL